MPPAATTKTLSPAELAKLEHAFATEPASEAYKPLAEAYLGMGRFMEAMVVCKKGVKAHPTVPDPRVLLARVYAEQGKDKKALEELASALQVAPSDKNVLRMTGALQLKSGEAEAGKANLLKAYQLEPADVDTKALLEQHKIQLPKAPEPVAPPPPPAAAPSAKSDSSSAPQAGPGTMAPQRSGRPNGAPAPNASGPRRGPPQRNSGERSAGSYSGSSGSSGSMPSIRSHDDEYEEDSAVRSRARRTGLKQGKKSTKSLFFLLVLFLPVSLATYYFVGQYRARQIHDRNKFLSTATAELKHDTYDSYQKACKAAEDALGKDPNSGAAHAYLAYANAIRWGEHGGGDSARQQAEQHLKEAKEAGEVSAYLYAADALIKTNSGKGSVALSELEKQVRAFDADGRKSALLYLTLGLLQMNAGDLEHARESLETAQGLTPDDARVWSALGRLFRARGEALQASKDFEFALRYERDHHESLLGGALLMLDQESPNYAVPAKMLKKLITAEPPPSPRQLAAAQLAQALLISRVSRAMQGQSADAQAKLVEATAVPMDPDKARAEMTKAESVGIDMARIEPDLYLIKARRLRGEGQVDQALGLIREAIKADPTRAHFYIELSRVLMEKQGGEAEAVSALLTAIKTMGESPKLLVMLGDAYRKQGKSDEAIAQYMRGVADPKAKNPEARFNLGVLYREKKDLAKAQEQLEKAAQEYFSQAYRLAMTKTELGRVYEEKGDRAKADEAYVKALESDGDYAPAYFFYGKFLAGDRKTASKGTTTLQKYLQLDPHGPYADDARRSM